MTIKYIDAHCHVQFKEFDEDREELLEQMREKGIAAVAVGCDLESSQKAVELAQLHDHVWAAVGAHPTDASGGFSMEEYRALALRARVVAIGECGLDYFRTADIASARAEQMPLFKSHVELAAELDKPLIIHARPSKGTMDAYQDIIAILTEAKKIHPNVRGDAHFFAGGVAEAEALVALDFTISFTAVITFARSYDDVIRSVPLTALLAETDAPFVAPVSRRGERNDPLAVVDVVEQLAKVRGESVEAVRAATVASAKSRFSL